jgi:predicted MarR family transcription regulator
MSTLDRKSWHLAENEDEANITELELLLWRSFHGFLRWQEGCELAVNGNSLTGNELSILHVVRMKERPKSIQDIARILNREDIFNIGYSVRKLVKMGLLEKSKESSAKNAIFQVTKEGIKNTDNLAKARKEILITLLGKKPRVDLLHLIQELSKIMTLYDEAARTTAAYKPSVD